MRNRINSSSELAGRLDKLHVSEYSAPSTDLTDPDAQVCLFGPERYEPRYEYPLIVWLHSCGSSERELEFVMPELSLQNYVACAPRGPIACSSEENKFRWGSSAAAAAITEEVVFEAIDAAAQQFSIAANRIFLAGFGGGASMAWRVALRYPKRFAGVVAICGDFPREHQPLTNLQAARDLPTLWMYGGESHSCGIQQVCHTLPILHAASLAVDIRQYPCGNELLSNMLVDTNSWLMEQVTRQPCTSETLQEESFSRN